MKWKLKAISVIFSIFFGLALAQDSRAQAVSIDLFYQELSPYGEWSPHIEFGYIWQPYNVGPGWQPYTDGRWEWSDQGWLWISYEPWGWATYHYGRWVYDDYQGWIWIPGTTWAPAWVNWYQGPEYVGWSPLPPDRGFFLEIGISFNFFESYYYEPYYHKHHHKKHHKKAHYYHDYYHNPHGYKAPAKHCVFVPYNNFGRYKHARKEAVAPANYDIVLRNSKNVTNIKYDRNKVVNYGPDKNFIEKRSNRKFTRHNIVDKQNFKSRKNRNVNNVSGNSFNAYRPKVERNAKNPSNSYRAVHNPNDNRTKNNIKKQQTKYNKNTKSKTRNSGLDFQRSQQNSNKNYRNSGTIKNKYHSRKYETDKSSGYNKHEYDNVKKTVKPTRKDNSYLKQGKNRPLYKQNNVNQKAYKNNQFSSTTKNRLNNSKNVNSKQYRQQPNKNSNKGKYSRKSTGNNYNRNVSTKTPSYKTQTRTVPRFNNRGFSKR